MLGHRASDKRPISLDNSTWLTVTGARAIASDIAEPGLFIGLECS